MFCLVNSITQSWMLEHWEGGPGSWCCREGLGFIFRQVQAKAKLPSTAFTLNTSCSSYSGSGRRQASLKRHVDLARGGRLFFPCRFLTQVQINLHVCHINWSRPSRKESAEIYILLSHKFQKKKGARRCLRAYKYRKRAFPVYVNSFKWVMAKPKKHMAARVPWLSAKMWQIQKEHLQQSTLNHNSSDPIRRIIFTVDDGSTTRD